ncbi:unnamed protein product [Cochlearia groenlandica]
MAATAALQTNIRPVNFPAPFTKQSSPLFRVRCSGIVPEVVSIAKNVLQKAGSLKGVEFSFREMAIGGAALDLVGVPLPETILAAKEVLIV